MKRTIHFMMDRGQWRLHLLLILVGIMSFNAKSQSCDSMQCRCEHIDLNPSGIMLGHDHPKGTWMFSYRYMDMRMRDKRSGTSAISDDIIFQNYIMSPKTMSMGMHMLMAMYGIRDRLSVMAMLNYNVLSMDMSMLPGAMTMQMQGMVMPDMSSTGMTYKTNGLGDTRLYATYKLLQRSRQRLMLSMGINLPTGNISLKGGNESMMPGQRLPYMMQLGSGTFDLLPGLTWLLGDDRLTWGIQATGALRPGYNPNGYAYGNELNATSWLSYRFIGWMSASLRAELSAADRIYGRDNNLYEIMEPGAKTANYGGTRATALAGLNFYMKKLANSKLSLEFGMPVYQNINGVQLATHSIFYTGWAVSF